MLSKMAHSVWSRSFNLQAMPVFASIKRCRGWSGAKLSLLLGPPWMDRLVMQIVSGSHLYICRVRVIGLSFSAAKSIFFPRNM